MAGIGNRVILDLDGAVARQHDAQHGRGASHVICATHWLMLLSRFHGGVISPVGSQRSSQLWPSFHRNTWPLISRQFRSIAAISRMSCSDSGVSVTALRLAKYCERFTEKGIGTWPR